VAERLDTSFHSLEQLQEFTRVPILVSIPPLFPGAHVEKRQRWRAAALGLAVVLGMGLTVTVSRVLAREGQVVYLVAGGR
jgi:hypothetical protein